MKTLGAVKSTKSNSPRGILLSIFYTNSAAGTMRVKLLLFQEYKKGLQEVSPPLAKVVISQLLIRAGWERVLALIHNFSILKQRVTKVSEVFIENGEGEGDSGNAKLCLLAGGFCCHTAGESGVERIFEAVLVCMEAFYICALHPMEQGRQIQKKTNKGTIKQTGTLQHRKQMTD